MSAPAPSAPTPTAIDRSGCPADHHGTASAKHNHGCTCPDSARAKYRQVKIRKLGRNQPVYVPGIGTSRRVRALQALGYSATYLGRELGCTKSQVRLYADDHPVRRTTHGRVLALYERLRKVPPPDDMGARRTRAHARAARWASPDQWDGVDIDDPAARSDLDYQRTPDSGVLMPEDIEWLASAEGGGLTDEQVAAKFPGYTADDVAQIRAAVHLGAAHRRLSDAAVLELRRIYLAEPWLRVAVLAAAVGITRGHLTNILAGRERRYLRLPDIRRAGRAAA